MTKTVLIIGAGRSGTKFLRGILAADARVQAVPYDINYVWRYGNEDYPDDVLPADRATERIASSIRRTVLRLAAGKGAGSDFVVEKTVSNSLRVEFVDRVFPDALYIHLVRDGRDVVESALRQWQKRPDLRYLLGKLKSFPIRNARYAAWFVPNLLAGTKEKRARRLWGPRYPGIEEDARAEGLAHVCARQWQECVERSLQAFARIDSRRYLTVKYEELVTGADELKRIADFIGLEDRRALTSAYGGLVTRDAVGQWKTRLPPFVAQQVQALLAPTLRTVGY